MARTKKISTIDLNWHARQLEAFNTHANEILFGGASEGGKSTFLRIAFILWCAHIKNLSAFIFRKYYNDVVTGHQDGPTSFGVLLKPWINDKIVRLTEDNIYFVLTNSNISLRQMRTDEDLEKNQGIEKHLMALDEATQLKQRHIQELRAWVRMPEEMKVLLPSQLAPLYPQHDASVLREMFPRIIYTANPIGASVGYFRRQFVQPRAPFTIERAPDKEGGFLRQYIPSRIDDNPSADKEAQRRRLSGLGESRAAALIGGIWDAPSGDYFKEYDDERHTTEDFTPPKGWQCFRTFDWGTHEPACCYWWCTSDGNEFTDSKGRKRWFPRGALICYREWYVCDPENPEKGQGLRNEDLCRGILSRSHEDWASGITLCDSLPFQDRGLERNGKKYTIADIFAEHGVPLTKANTARITGYSYVRDRLIGIPDGDGGKIPMIYFCQSCIYVREYMPALPYSDTNEEDAADSGESTHSTDCVRYACATSPTAHAATKPVASAPTPGNISVMPIIKMIRTPPKRPQLR